MKLSKDAVAYEHPAAKPENHCGVCRHFEPPGSCGIVAGRIRPEDWCRRFVRSKVMAGWQDGFSDWVDLEYDDEDMADNHASVMPSPPQYPYGMRICFCTRELEKLGLPLPQVGNLIDLRAFAEVTGVHDQEGERRVEMQIIRIKVENEDEEDDDGEEG